jgi:starch-binding outer membrane protein, SusD/RagB family
MRRIKLFFIVTALISLGSCVKELDTVPSDFVSNVNFYSNAKELDAALAGIYDPLLSGGNGYYGAMYSEHYRIGFIGTDESSVSQRMANNDYPSHYNETTNSAFVGNFWASCYDGINRANTFLENINKSTSITEDQRNGYKGEVTFLRAYYYFLLTQWFGDVPLRTKSTTSLEDAQVEFTPSIKVYDFIISEMTLADNLLAKQTADKMTNSERVSQTAVEGILARVCLYAAGNPINDTKRYAEASSWAKKVIASGLHRLNPDFQQVFINHSADLPDNTFRESMWEIGALVALSDVTAREGTIPRTGISAATGLLSASSGFERVTPRAYYTFADGDLRRDWSIAPFYYTSNGFATTVVNTTNYFADSYTKWNREPGKWRRYYENITISTSVISNQNVPLLRYSDVLLMFAEAEFEVKNRVATPEVIDAINQVRRRGYGELRNVRGIGTITLNTAGSGYTTSPNITFVGGTRVQRNATIAGRPYLTEDPRAVGVVSSGAVTGFNITTTGDGYTALPNVVVGDVFTPNTTYALGAQVVNANNLYRVTTAGTSGTVPPTQTTGTFTSGTVVFTRVGVPATATAGFASADLTSVSIQDIQDERLRELSFELLRRQDLKRWGILVDRVKEIGTEVANGSIQRRGNGTQFYGPFTVQSLTLNTTFNGASTIFSTGPSNIGPKNIFLPIPVNEIINNKKSKQNSGF